MSDTMLTGVLRMPFRLAMGDALSSLQFYERAQEALDRMERAESALPRWIKMTERRPERGALIVKRWKSGSVWAGVYSGTEKDSSFDEWVQLPSTLPSEGKMRKEMEE